MPLQSAGFILFTKKYDAHPTSTHCVYKPKGSALFVFLGREVYEERGISMKKKIASLLLAGVLVLTLAGCAKHAAETPADSEGEQQETEAQEPENTHTIETPQERYLPVTLSYEYDYRTADDGTTIVSGKCPIIALKELSLKGDGTTNWRQADGYEKLADTVDSWNQNSYVTFKGSMDEAEGYAKEAYGTDLWTEGMYYADETTATVTRTDSAILSVFLMEYSYEGGAHPSTMYSSANFDSETGNILSLSDVVKDMDAFVETVTTQLTKDYPDIEGDLINGALPDAVKDALTNPDYVPCFTLSSTGISVAFSAYTLTTYAYGPEFVDLSFSDYPDLFNEKYTKADDTYFAPIEEGPTVTIPTGQRLSWYLETAMTSEGIDDPANYKLHITVDGHETEFPAELSYSVKAYGLFKNNKYYLYCDAFSDNDFHFLTIYEISGNGATCLTGDNPLSLGFYDVTPVDPENFILQNRSSVLGSEQVGRYYSVGSDGLPKANGDVWTFIITDENGDLANRTLTAKQDVDLVKVKDASDFDSEGEKESVKAGTTFTLLTTNANDSGIVKADAILKAADGTYYRVTVTAGPEESGYVHLIDGQEDYEVFDGLILAG